MRESCHTTAVREESERYVSAEDKKQYSSGDCLRNLAGATTISRIGTSFDTPAANSDLDQPYHDQGTLICAGLYQIFLPDLGDSSRALTENCPTWSAPVLRFV